MKYQISRTQNKHSVKYKHSKQQTDEHQQNRNSSNSKGCSRTYNKGGASASLSTMTALGNPETTNGYLHSE